MRMGWMKRAALAAFAASSFGVISAHADDNAAWLKDRQARFAAHQAAHPNPDAEIAEIKAKTAALIAAYVPPSTAEKYADLKARSGALTTAQRAQAQGIFATGFKLWQSGDYASAKEAFNEGLTIDPANGMANYYIGDILSRQNAGGQAAVAMDKAASLAPDTPEAFKAKAALRNLPGADTDPALERAPVIWRASDAPLELWDGADYPEMVVVPAGEYTMGSPVTEANHEKSESPRHRVRIGYSFAVSKYPITVGEFAQFVAETHYDAGNQCYTQQGGSYDMHNGRNWRRPDFDQTSQSPAVCMNYNDAQAYVAWLSQKTGHAYRLLSEAEYEYANRGGSTTAYWWGDDIGKSQADCEGCGSAWDNKQTAPVGSFKPNAFGLYDTTGNVWSWLSDCWNETYNGAPTDGSANAGGDCGQRSLRGGSWSSNPTILRAARRLRRSAGNRYNNYGFRLARTL